MKKWTLAFGLALLTGSLYANKIGDVEKFALADNREQALAELIPGTDDYYFYNCLFHQHEGDLARVDKLLKEWDERRSHVPNGFNEIRNRQALLRYDGDAKAKDEALRYLKSALNLRFDHRRDADATKANLSSRLDQGMITRDAYWQESIKRRRLDNAHRSLNNWLMTQDLDRDRRRWLLARLERPDHDGLVDLIVKDLKDKHARPFGSYKVHKLLTKSQLDELGKALPKLRAEGAYVTAYLERLRPSTDVDPHSDSAVREAWLVRPETLSIADALGRYGSGQDLKACKGLSIEIHFHH